MKPIQVKAGGKQTGNVVFDQMDAGVVLNAPARVVIRANGKAHVVDGTLKVVKDAIERGDLIQVYTDPAEAQAALDARKAADFAEKK